jgi:hypothetical protein
MLFLEKPSVAGSKPVLLPVKLRTALSLKNNVPVSPETKLASICVSLNLTLISATSSSLADFDLLLLTYRRYWYLILG